MKIIIEIAQKLEGKDCSDLFEMWSTCYIYDLSSSYTKNFDPSPVLKYIDCGIFHSNVFWYKFEPYKMKQGVGY